MEMPDVTLVQKLVACAVGLVMAVSTVLASFGIASATQATAIAGLITALGGIYVAADAIIRNGRSRVAANPEAMREARPLPPPALRK